MQSKRKKEFLSYYDEFKKDSSEKALYNLPSKVQFCKTCLMSNQKPAQSVEHMSNQDDHKLTLKFTDGICHACNFKKEKKENILFCMVIVLTVFQPKGSGSRELDPLVTII